MSYQKRTYSASGKEDIRYIFEISPVQYFTQGVDSTEFQCIFIVSILAVCVVTSPK